VVPELSLGGWKNVGGHTKAIMPYVPVCMGQAAGLARRLENRDSVDLEQPVASQMMLQLCCRLRSS
jgi:hypothetical protein